MWADILRLSCGRIWLLSKYSRQKLWSEKWDQTSNLADILGSMSSRWYFQAALDMASKGETIKTNCLKLRQQWDPIFHLQNWKKQLENNTQYYWDYISTLLNRRPFIPLQKKIFKNMHIIWLQNSTSENVFQKNNLISATIYPLVYVKQVFLVIVKNWKSLNYPAVVNYLKEFTYIHVKE